MSINKFKPLIWASKFQEDLERNAVFYADCNHEYEGEAKKAGDTLWIPGYGDVTTRRFSDGRLHDLNAPEEIDSLGQALPITEISDFYFYVDDLDKRQAQGGEGLLSKYMNKARKRVNLDEDSYIASLAKDENVQVLDKSDTACTKSNVLEFLDEALEKLAENDVPTDEDIVITGCPKLTTKLRQAFIVNDTNNSEIMKNGKIGMYSRATLKESNNVYTEVNGNDTIYNIQVKTRNAITAVHPYFFMKPEEPSGKWQDAVKGYMLYAAKVTAPKEMINLRVKF